MKFKVGQKVRIVKWLNMPQDMVEKWGINLPHIGEVGIIEEQNFDGKPGIAYNVKRKGAKYAFFCFEEELESIIKVGEQLEFVFMSE